VSARRRAEADAVLFAGRVFGNLGIGKRITLAAEIRQGG
jgi:hypothetical protein